MRTIFTTEIENEIAVLPAGESTKIDGEYDVVYEFSKNPNWNGNLESQSNTVFIKAYYNNECIASVDKEAWVTNEHFSARRILDGMETMRGTERKSTCVLEELRARGVSLDCTPEKLFASFLDMTEFSLEDANNPDAPEPKEGETGDWYLEDTQNGWQYIHEERFVDAYDIMSRLDSCFTDCILHDLDDEVEYYKINDKTDTSNYTPADWARFFRKNDNYECFNDLKRKNIYKFIQEHRYELELCELYNEDKCKNVDLDKVYELMHGELPKTKKIERAEKDGCEI